MFAEFALFFDTPRIASRQYKSYRTAQAFAATTRIGMAHERLRSAREQAGFKEASAFAKAFDLTESTYRSHENGTRALTIPAAKRYAKILQTRVTGISWLYLMEGPEAQHLNQGKHKGKAVRQPLAASNDDVILVDEYDVRVSAGGGFNITRETKKDVWRFSRQYLANELRVPTGNLVVLEVQGDSMEPTLHTGDRVLVNMNDRRVSQPGIFVLWDGDGTVVKRLETIPGSDPPKLFRISDNPKHRAYEVLAEETNIIGRVVWVARKM